MIKTILFLILCSLFLFPLFAEANKSNLNPNDFFPNSSEFVNPFTAKHKAKEVPIPVIPTPVTQPTPISQQPANITTQPTNTHALQPITGSQTSLQQIVTFPELLISGLIWNSTRPQAIVNQEVVEAGDVIKDAKIIEITKKGIIIEFDGEMKVLTP